MNASDYLQTVEPDGSKKGYSTAPRKAALVVIDPNQIVRLGVKTLFSVVPNVRLVAERGDVRSGLDCVGECRPDVIITDVVGWPLEGFQWIRRLLQTVPGTRIVVYSASAEERHIIGALASGAMAYVLKKREGNVLLRAVDAAIEGDMLLDVGIASAVVRCVHMEKAPLNGAAFLDLSHQETRILALISEGLPNRKIACQINLSPKTVRNYVSQILAKLKLQTRTEAAAYAIRHGIDHLSWSGARVSFPAKGPPCRAREIT